MTTRPEILLRGGLWIGIAGLTFLAEALGKITPEQLAAWTALDSARISCGFLLSIFTVWRAYIDQSAARYTAPPPPAA